jgi:4-hydroxy-tetrahydrodipicolinate synthase
VTPEGELFMSANRGEAFAGCTVALVTPFRDREVDEQALRALVEWHISEGTPILSPVGTTGESPTLSHDEHERVIALVVEQARGRAKVLAGTGSNATSEAIRLTKFAHRAGADGALVVVPYYNRPSQEGLYRHYATLAESCELPIVLYNVPSRTGRNLEPETVERLGRFPTIVAIKEAAGSLDQVSELLLRTPLTVLSGDDSLTLPLLAIGAGGVVSVAANIVPRDILGLVQAYRDGNLADARARHLRLFPLCRDLLGLGPNPVPVKTAMALLGRGNGELRLPLCSLEEAPRETLRQALIRYGMM